MRPLATRFLMFVPLAVLPWAALADAAPPKVDAFFPTGVQRGEEATLTAAGSFDQWPLSAWVDRPGIEITALEEKGKLRVRASTDAASGLYWVRLYGNDGASALRPIFVDHLLELPESEPNNQIAEANPVRESSIISGRLQARGDVDSFLVELSAGDTLVASLDAQRTLGSPMDAVLQVCTRDGFVLEQNDDARGLDPLIAFEAPQNGAYLVRTFAFPATPDSTIGLAGGDSFRYRLTLTTGGFIDHALPLAVAADGSSQVTAFGWNIPADTAPLQRADTVFHPSLSSFATVETTPHNVFLAAEDGSAERPQAITLPADISGRLSQPGQTQAFVFSARKDQKIEARVESKGLGFLVQPELKWQAADGSVVGEQERGRGGGGRRRGGGQVSGPTITIPSDGDYRLVVRDAFGHGSLRHVYRLTVRETEPDFQLTLAADTFTLTPGQPLEIAVAIDRQQDLRDEIEVSVVGLPEGVRCQPVTSQASGDTAKSVKLTIEAEAESSSGPIEIVGRVLNGKPRERTASFEIAGLSRRHTQAWLTVVKQNSR